MVNGALRLFLDALEGSPAKEQHVEKVRAASQFAVQQFQRAAGQQAEGRLA